MVPSHLLVAHNASGLEGMNIFLVSAIKLSGVEGGINFPVKQKLPSNELQGFISQNKRKKSVLFQCWSRFIFSCWKRENKWGRGAKRKKIISGEFFDGGNPTGKLQFSKDMQQRKQFPFPPPSYVERQNTMEPRSFLFLNSAAALPPGEVRDFYVLLATGLWSSPSRG